MRTQILKPKLPQLILCLF